MATATLKHLRITPTKVRRVARLVSGKAVDQATNILTLDTHASSDILAKIIASAAANAVNNEGANEDKLVVRTIMVNQGKSLRRTLPRSRGRADIIRKRMSHVTVVVEEKTA
jgi:large subunit ribosomal protein L22